MFEDSEIAKALIKNLSKQPKSAERFQIAPDLEVDILEFEDRPYVGVNSIITNGARAASIHGDLEFVLTFSANSISHEVDPKALMATYLQLRFLPSRNPIGIGDCFKVSGSLMEGHGFIGMYTTSPCYFPPDTLSSIRNVKFLWLFPIFKNEYEFIQRFGADEFESYLSTNDPDLSRYDRSPLELSAAEDGN